MQKKLLCLICFLGAHLFYLSCASAYASDGDDNYITEWEMLKLAIKGYNDRIKNKENIENAKQAEERGRTAFLNGDYARADYRGYGDAIAWIPRPEYFFIVGDIGLRHKLSLHADSPYATPEYKACWDKYLFGLDVRKNIESNFERGFAIVGELNLSATRNSKIYKQAIVNLTCFQRLTSEHSEWVGPQCVPVEEVKRCLGSPLLFLYH